jgi:predicted membrane channel-forming protein YqfA (hemolysin III family)
MDNNTLLAVVFAATGLVDLVLARVLAAQLAPAARRLLIWGGFAFLLLGALFYARVITL